MARKKRKVLENLEIIDAGSEGKSIGKLNDQVVFVTGCVPGDIVDVLVTRKKKKFLEGRPIRFEKYSEKRVEPVCEHFGVCGGCKWQNMPYADQLFYKEKQVRDNLTRLGKFDCPELSPILASETTEFYRNKLEFTATDRMYLSDEDIKSGNEYDRRALGFHVPGRFDWVIDINKCHLQADPSNKIRLVINAYMRANELPFFHLQEQTGFLRTVIIRTSTTGDIMVIVAFYENRIKDIEGMLNDLLEQVPEISSMMYVVNNKKNDTISDLAIQCYKGKPYIEELMEGLTFRIGPKSFYQTNSVQAYELYKIARDYAGLQANELVYDLYTGTGTIANFVASSCKKVVGIEYVPEAIEDAKVNSEINSIENTSFFAGDMKDVLNNSFISEHGKPDVIITDPPRAGMHEDVIKRMLEIEAKRIVYVSCNPATQARDITLLDPKYRVTKVQPVDMFPHTHHVENVVLLELR